MHCSHHIIFHLILKLIVEMLIFSHRLWHLHGPECISYLLFYPLHFAIAWQILVINKYLFIEKGRKQGRKGGREGERNGGKRHTLCERSCRGRNDRLAQRQ